MKEYYFFFNFRNLTSKSVLIHKASCGHCKDGLGKHGSLSNENGFWAGPFGTVDSANTALIKLQKLITTQFTYQTCGCILQES
jgi:hypothetical protein